MTLTQKIGMKIPSQPLPIWKHLFSATALAAVTLMGGHAVLAQATQLSSGGGPTISTAYPGASGSTLSSPFSVAAGPITLTFTDAGGTFLRQNSTAGNTAFPTGTVLIDTTNGVGPAGPLTITFSQPVLSFGLSVQDVVSDTETFSFSTTSGAGNVVNPFTVGPLTNTGAIGAAAFIGAQYTGAAGSGIKSVTINGSSSVAAASNDFYAGPVSVNASNVVPESSGLANMSGALLALGLVGAGTLVSKRRRCQNRNL